METKMHLYFAAGAAGFASTLRNGRVQILAQNGFGQGRRAHDLLPAGNKLLASCHARGLEVLPLCEDLLKSTAVRQQKLQNWHLSQHVMRLLHALAKLGLVQTTDCAGFRF